jgi:hypothetical protein
MLSMQDPHKKTKVQKHHGTKAFKGGGLQIRSVKEVADHEGLGV